MNNKSTNIAKCRGERCNEFVYWGTMFGKRHPFDFTGDGTNMTITGSHFDTCIDAGKFRGGLRANLNRRFGTIEVQQGEWQRANRKLAKPCREIKWHNATLVNEVSKEIRTQISKLLCRSGGPFQAWLSPELDDFYFYTVVKDGHIVAIVLKSVIYNRIHEYLHDIAFSVFDDMADRKPVCVAGYQLEPYCAVPIKCLP